MFRLKKKNSNDCIVIIAHLFKVAIKKYIIFLPLVYFPLDCFEDDTLEADADELKVRNA